VLTSQHDLIVVREELARLVAHLNRSGALPGQLQHASERLLLLNMLRYC